MAAIDIDRLYSTGVVVRDLEAATLRYAEIFGIDEWDVRDYGPDRLASVESYGRPTMSTFRTATGTTPQPIDAADWTAVTFELVQPLTGESPFQEFRFVRGQGISHLTLAIRDSASFERMRQRLKEKGIFEAGSMTVDGRLSRHFFDTRRELGGYLIEVQVAGDGDTAPTIGVSETWDHAGRYTRPTGVGPVSVQGVNHFGIVVDDVMSSINNYNDLFGLTTWSMRNWRTEPGLLEQPYYRGQAVDHEYFTGMASVSDFGFEIIQPTLGPSHYNREFRDLTGAGAHHMLLSITSDEGEWDELRRWLGACGVPVAMGADLWGGSAHFRYYDTHDALGGYLLEAVLRRWDPDVSIASPAYTIDLAANMG